jgi:hypothetical protein
VKHRFLLPGLASILLLAAGWAWWFTSKHETVPEPRAGDPLPPARHTLDRPRSNDSTAAKPAAEGVLSTTDVKPVSRESILAEIEEASVTYDAAALPRIERFLLHPDPEVRESARNGMIVLGDPAAGPLLRAASRHTADSREAAALIEAADYVELPSKPPKRRKHSPIPGHTPVR